MKNKVGKIFSWIFIGILVLIAGSMGVILIQSKKNSDKIPSIFGYKPFIVLSESMETEINEGDLVIVKNVDVKTLKKNDVIAFRDNDDYVVTHRIVDVIYNHGQVEFVTKGDNNNTNDSENVKGSAVEGVYQFKISGLGNVLVVMQKPTTLIFILFVILSLGILYIIFDNGRISASEKRELEELRKKQKDMLN